jgi:hypothetical protein
MLCLLALVSTLVALKICIWLEFRSPVLLHNHAIPINFDFQNFLFKHALFNFVFAKKSNSIKSIDYKCEHSHDLPFVF